MRLHRAGTGSDLESRQRRHWPFRSYNKFQLETWQCGSDGGCWRGADGRVRACMRAWMRACRLFTVLVQDFQW